MVNSVDIQKCLLTVADGLRYLVVEDDAAGGWERRDWQSNATRPVTENDESARTAETAKIGGNNKTGDQERRG